MLDQKKLQEILDYCPVTGEFTWKVDRTNRVRVGQIAGHISPAGYHSIMVDECNYRRSRLAWLYVYGTWPIGQIDHINMNRLDDRIGNLREATNSQNGANRVKQKNNTSGYKGVDFHKGKWRAKCRGRSIGYFKTPQEAHLAYQKAAAQMYGTYARF